MPANIGSYAERQSGVYHNLDYRTGTGIFSVASAEYFLEKRSD
jgi:hypothetical protein